MWGLILQFQKTILVVPHNKLFFSSILMFECVTVARTSTEACHDTRHIFLTDQTWSSHYKFSSFYSFRIHVFEKKKSKLKWKKPWRPTWNTVKISILFSSARFIVQSCTYVCNCMCTLTYLLSQPVTKLLDLKVRRTGTMKSQDGVTPSFIQGRLRRS